MHIRSLLGHGLSIKGRQEASVSELGRWAGEKGHLQGTRQWWWLQQGGGAGGSHRQQIAEKSRGGQGWAQKEGVSLRNHLRDTWRMPHQTWRPLQGREPPSALILPGPKAGPRDGFDCSPFLLPRFLLPCQRKLTEKEWRSAMELGGTPCHPSQRDIYRHSCADSAVTVADGPWDAALFPARPPSLSPSFPG